MTTTVPNLTEILNTRFGGVLNTGKHNPPDGDCNACILELCSIAMGIDWTDDPELVGLPDIRPINDIQGISPRHRAARMIELATAYWGWSNWTAEERKRTVSRIAILTVNRLIAELPGLSDAIRQQCRDAVTIEDACAAADAADAADVADVAAADAAAGAYAAA